MGDRARVIMLVAITTGVIAPPRSGRPQPHWYGTLMIPVLLPGGHRTKIIAGSHGYATCG
ncbi:MAG TPA: hypothetical protein VFP34_02265 [Microlunatus sp.]|nr:hypothetical protein [Microlunatus sp.]